MDRKLLTRVFSLFWVSCSGRVLGKEVLEVSIYFGKTYVAQYAYAHHLTKAPYIQVFDQPGFNAKVLMTFCFPITTYVSWWSGANMTRLIPFSGAVSPVECLNHNCLVLHLLQDQLQPLLMEVSQENSRFADLPPRDSCLVKDDTAGNLTWLQSLRTGTDNRNNTTCTICSVNIIA